MLSNHNMGKILSDNNIVALYSAIDNIDLIYSSEECIHCASRCRRDLYVHWLLPEEVTTMSSHGVVIRKLSLNSGQTGFFFSEGLCPLLTESGCSIYKTRPLECRLNPLSVLDNKFVLYKDCPIVLNSTSAICENITHLIPSLMRIMKPWKQYLAQLAPIILAVEPNINNKVIPIGEF